MTAKKTPLERAQATVDQVREQSPGIGALDVLLLSLAAIHAVADQVHELRAELREGVENESLDPETARTRAAINIARAKRYAGELIEAYNLDPAEVAAIAASLPATSRSPRPGRERP